MLFTSVHSIHFLPPKEHKMRKFALWLLVLGPLAIGCLALLLGQDANWDLRNYHWYNAYAFVNGRWGKDLLPAQTPWFYNPTLDVPFYLLATHVPAMVAGFVLAVVQGLNFVLLFMLAYAGLVITNPRQKVVLCAVLAAMGVLGGGGIAQIGTTFYDNVTSLGLFLSAILVLRHYETLLQGAWGRAIGVAILCGLPAGMAMGLKLPCFTFCFGLCGAFLFLSETIQRRFVLSFAFGVGILIGVAITLGHWAWFLQTHYGSPLFPYFNEVFKAPLAPLSSARDTQYIPRSWHDFLMFPFIFVDSPFRTGEIPFRDLRIPILYVLLPCAIVARLVFGRSKLVHNAVAVPQVARYLLWCVVIAYFAWLVMFGIYRYAVPMEMLAPLLIVFAVGYLPIKPLAQTLLVGFILVVIVATLQPGNWGRRVTWSSHFVEAVVPELGDVSNTILLMAGFEPYSHLVTQLPPEMPVVRIQSNFASPDQDKAINQVTHARINEHKGSFLILIPIWQHKVADEAMGFFHLAGNWKACQNVKDLLFDGAPYDLCPVNRLSE